MEVISFAMGVLVASVMVVLYHKITTKAKYEDLDMSAEYIWELEKTLSQNIADLRESINDFEFELSEKINDLKVEMSLSKVGISLKEWYGARSQSQCAKQDQESGESENAQCVRGEEESGENVGNTGVTKNSSILR